MNIAHLPFNSANPYQQMLIDEMSKEVDFVDLGMVEPRSLGIRAIRKDVDVLHIHWAHFFYRESLAKTIGKFALFHLNLFALSFLDIKVVWTIHNDKEHEGNFPTLDYFNRVLIAFFSDKVTVWDENTKKTAACKFCIPEEKLEIVPHGNYLPVIEKHKVRSKEEARKKLDVDSRYSEIYLFAGMIRPYKQVPELIEAFQETSKESDLLIVVGKPYTEDYREKIESKTEKLENVRTELKYISEQKLIDYYRAANWAVFPYKHIFNSGSVYYSMSTGTPVIAPKIGVIQGLDDRNNIVYGCLKKALRASREKTVKEDETIDLMKDKYSWTKVKNQLMEIYSK